tara:strand:+ start:204 stop:425 length:222 start_codon:yes stop_codon:yes gene_type:complete
MHRQRLKVSVDLFNLFSLSKYIFFAALDPEYVMENLMGYSGLPNEYSTNRTHTSAIYSQTESRQHGFAQRHLA